MDGLHPHMFRQMSANAQRENLSALVADDDDQNARLLVRILESGGYGHVECTTSSAEVMDLCREHDPDLLLLDISMPPPTGFDILQELVAYEGTPPVTVVLTGHEHPSIERRALDLGAAAVLGKSTSRHELLDRLDAVLSSRPG